MVLLERVMEMKKNGIPESQIIQTLQQEGISPKVIEETISQSQIKSAINTEQQETKLMSTTQGQQEAMPQNPGQIETFQNKSQNYNPPNQSIPTPTSPNTRNIPLPSETNPISQGIQPQGIQPQETPRNQQGAIPQDQMRPSIMPTNEERKNEFEKPQIPIPLPQNTRQIPSSYQPSSAPYNESPESIQGEYENYPAPSPDQDYSTTDPYQEGQGDYYQEYNSGQPADIETINDIAEQIVEEKNIELKNQISEFTKFRKEIALEVKRMNERLQKVENNFNSLQMAIISKIGDYGNDIKNISKEMYATQDSFSKILDPLTENIKELKKITKSEKK